MVVLSLLDVPMSTDSTCSRMTEAALPAPCTAGISMPEKRATRRESKVMLENSPFSDMDGVGSSKSPSHLSLSSLHIFFMSGWHVCRDAGQIAPMKLSCNPAVILEFRQRRSAMLAFNFSFACTSSGHRIGSASVQRHSRSGVLTKSCLDSCML